MKKALMYAHVAYMIQQFNMDNIRLLLDLGYEVDVACNMEQGSPVAAEKVLQLKRELRELGVQLYHVPVPRKISKVKDILTSIVQTKRLMDENGYDLIHCHSPIGGMICRVGYRLSKRYKKARMLYTAHGFHFYQGAPRKNWLLYYPVEKLCSCWTDVLITMNQEDYALAAKRMKAHEARYIPGVGIDLKRIGSVAVDRRGKREELGVPEEETLLLSVGEVNENKNHETVIRAMAQLKNEKLHYVIAGSGPLQTKLGTLAAELGVRNQVKLLGYRSDIIELCKSADVFVFPSYREGLSVALMEAMACGLPVVCSRIRGNTDLIDESGGMLFDPCRAEDCACALGKVINSHQMECFGAYNAEKVKNFSLDAVNTIMQKMYRDISSQ